MSKVNESRCGRICEEVEMRKGSFFILGSLLLFATLSYAATVERVLVRQQWPWHRLVKVEYRLSDVSSPVDISVSLSAGGTAVVVPADALDGALFAISSGGVYSFTIDPSKTSLAEVPRLSDLRVMIAPVAASASSLFALYKVYDLVSGECEDVTAGEIVNGQRGAWKLADTNAAHLAAGTVNAAAVTNIIWTGFNSGNEYKTSKLVMRYLPGATAKVNLLNRSDKDPATIGVDYYAGVYEVTQKQWELVYGSAAACSWVSDTKPVNTVSYNSIRGADATNYWSAATGGNAPHPDSFLGKLRAKTGGVAFDLPTRAMMEYATQANSLWRLASNGKDASICKKSAWNDNSPFANIPISSGTVDDNLPGTYAGNAGSAGPAVVGSYACNMVGLYDTIGNVREWCVDWHDGNVSQTNYNECQGAANVDPEDPSKVWKNNVADKTGYKRFRFGSIYSTPLSNGMTPNYLLSGWGLAPSGTDADTGFRLVVVVGE